MSQYSDYEQYDDSFSDSDNEILQSGEVKNRNMKAGYSSFADQEDLMESLSNALDSKSDSPKQQSKKLKKLLKQDKPKSKAKAEHKGGGFKLKKSTKGNKKSKPKEDNIVFGVSLLTAVQRSKLAADGIELPTVFRECINILEDRGLEQEGIYRLSGMKSKIDEIKAAYDRGEEVDLESADANVVASLLKQYLRELPDSLLTSRLQDRFEMITKKSNSIQQIIAMREVLADMPSHNRLMLGWLMVHMSHIVKHVSVNKMGIPNIIIVLSPTLQTSPAVLAIMLNNVKEIFSDVTITKYVRPQEEEVVIETTHEPSNSLDTFNTPEKVVAEIERLGSILQKLHGQMAGKFNENEERIWELQRTITNLRRKLKSMKSQSQPAILDVTSEPEGFLNTLIHMETTLLAEKDVLMEANELLKGEIKKEAELIEQCKTELSRVPPVEDEYEFFEDVDVAELAKQVAALKWQRKELQVNNSELRDAIIQERDSIRDLNTKLRIHAVTEQTAAVS
ncbi:ralA-binding protein 1-like [Dysidea avara]|uniref:ralA-binding protein 1-like n=1 Tax=Dysidea avara TaxID=196820 RepID=UPI003328D7D5